MSASNEAPGKVEITSLYEDDYLKISLNEESVLSSDKIILSFTGIGHAMGGIDVQKLEFAGTGLRFGAPIFITDKQRSWGNNLDFTQIFDMLSPYLKDKSVYAIGNSMGGFLAVLASNFIRLDCVIAFVPQFSVDARVLPEEHRWMAYRKEIKVFRYPSLQGQFNDTTQYYLLSGAGGLESLHWKRFPSANNVYNLIIEGTEHDVAIYLKKHRLLDEVILNVLDNPHDFDGLMGRFESAAVPVTRVK